MFRRIFLFSSSYRSSVQIESKESLLFDCRKRFKKKKDEWRNIDLNILNLFSNEACSQLQSWAARVVTESWLLSQGWNGVSFIACTNMYLYKWMDDWVKRAKRFSVKMFCLSSEPKVSACKRFDFVWMNLRKEKEKKRRLISFQCFAFRFCL